MAGSGDDIYSFTTHQIHSYHLIICLLYLFVFDSFTEPIGMGLFDLGAHLFGRNSLCCHTATGRTWKLFGRYFATVDGAIRGL